MRSEKLTARACRAAFDMSRIRELAAGDAGVERLVSAAFSATLAAATRNHAAKFLPGGICAADQITSELRERRSGMPMTSTGAEYLFALGCTPDVRAGASRDDTRAGVILGHADGTAAWKRERADGEKE
eukprot:6198671-Pleurochrysis_carterae.AAC.1